MAHSGTFGRAVLLAQALLCPPKRRVASTLAAIKTRKLGRFRAASMRREKEEQGGKMSQGNSREEGLLENKNRIRNS
jgi:hypothetical protein